MGTLVRLRLLAFRDVNHLRVLDVEIVYIVIVDDVGSHSLAIHLRCLQLRSWLLLVLRNLVILHPSQILLDLLKIVRSAKIHLCVLSERSFGLL